MRPAATLVVVGCRHLVAGLVLAVGLLGACADDASPAAAWTVDDAVLDVAVWPEALSPPLPPMVRWLGHPEGLFAAERDTLDALLADFGLPAPSLAQSLAPGKPVRIQRRQNGDVLVEFSAPNAAAAAAALARGAASRGLVVKLSGEVFEASDAGGRVVLVGRRHGARVLLFLQPQDPLLAKSHLATLPAGPAPAWDKPQLLVAAVAPSRGAPEDVLSALLDGVERARLTVPPAGAAKMVFDLVAPVAADTLQHRFCGAPDGDVFRGALPAALLGADERLTGAVAVRLLRPVPGKLVDAGDPFSFAPFLVVGEPASPEAAQSLRASFVEAAHIEQTTVGTRSVLVHTPKDGAAHRTLRAVIDEQRFVLSNFSASRFATALGDLERCAPSSTMFVDGPGLRAGARAASVGDQNSGPARVRRVVGRLFAGAGEVRPTVLVQDKTVTIRF